MDPQGSFGRCGQFLPQLTRHRAVDQVLRRGDLGRCRKKIRLGSETQPAQNGFAGNLRRVAAFGQHQFDDLLPEIIGIGSRIAINGRRKPGDNLCLQVQARNLAEARQIPGVEKAAQLSGIQRQFLAKFLPACLDRRLDPPFAAQCLDLARDLFGKRLVGDDRETPLQIAGRHQPGKLAQNAAFGLPGVLGPQQPRPAPGLFRIACRVFELEIAKAAVGQPQGNVHRLAMLSKALVNRIPGQTLDGDAGNPTVGVQQLQHFPGHPAVVEIISGARGRCTKQAVLHGTITSITLAGHIIRLTP
ncbi:hypothetical protein [Tistrella mobilis]|uniref:hypothetical protein n=2 Tax=Tistrella mobilis TaxID=171437 RepID=UPI001E52665A|nr:hypothetical protein [Tistrella mobilis]